VMTRTVKTPMVATLMLLKSSATTRNG
jgi:hypothetical protein